MDTKKLPSLQDVGIRYDHLKDYADSLQVCIDRLIERGIKTRKDALTLAKFSAAVEVINNTLDAQTGINNPSNEYLLYKLVDKLPTKGDELDGGRGEPLAKPYEPWKETE